MSETSRRLAGRRVSGGARVMPRASSSFSIPARLSAVRSPATACSAAAPCTCTPRTRALAGREDFELVFFSYRTAEQRSGYDRSEALHGEHAVNGQAEECARIPRADLGRHPRQLALELFDAGAGLGADGDHGRALQKRPAQELFEFQTHHVEGFLVHQVGLGQDGDAARYGKQAADLEVLARLRLDGFVRRHHQQHQVNAPHAGQHVAHETLVSGDVHKAQAQRFAVRGWELEVRKAQVDGDAAALLFRQAVGVDAGQRLHQRGFAVVDVPGGPDDDGLHRRE